MSKSAVKSPANGKAMSKVARSDLGLVGKKGDKRLGHCGCCCIALLAAWALLRRGYPLSPLARGALRGGPTDTGPVISEGEKSALGQPVVVETSECGGMWVRRA